MSTKFIDQWSEMAVLSDCERAKIWFQWKNILFPLPLPLLPSWNSVMLMPVAWGTLLLTDGFHCLNSPVACFRAWSWHSGAQTMHELCLKFITRHLQMCWTVFGATEKVCARSKLRAWVMQNGLNHDMTEVYNLKKLKWWLLPLLCTCVQSLHE